MRLLPAPANHPVRSGLSTAQRAFHHDVVADTIPYEPERRTLRSRLYEEFTRLALEYRADGSVTLVEIECYRPSRGYGGQTLDWLCRIADRHHIGLSLFPCAFGDENLPLHNQDRLVAWYMRRGFTSPAGHSKLQRLPHGLRP